MQYLKANTAATILIGPFVDKGDGVTPEEGITLANVDSAELMKNDGTSFVDLTSDSRTWAHREKGMYTLVITTDDTDTEGRLTIFFSDEAVCLPVWKDFMVLAEAAYDSMFTAKDTGLMDVHVKTEENIDFGATKKTSLETAVDDGLDNAIGGSPTADSVAQRLKAIDLLVEASGAGDLAAVLTAIQHATYGLSAIRTRGDIAWITGGGGGDATAANQLLLIQILTGKWEVVGNQFIIYDSDGTTPLYTYDLTQRGVATQFNPDLRTPV